MSDQVEDGQLSESLLSFVAEAPLTRGPNLAFVRQVAAELEPGSRLLDVGAGDAPYRELFAHVRYETCDWENSLYEQASQADVVGSADRLPVAAGTYDAILNTQVLEHVPRPAAVLAELRRVLRPGGKLFLTAPFVWYLHEEPYDFFRYTSHGLRYLVEEARFADVVVRPMNNSFSTVAQMTAHLAYMAGRSDDGFDLQRDLIGRVVEPLSAVLESMGSLDAQWLLPMNFSVTAVRGPESLDEDEGATPSVEAELADARAEVARLRAELESLRVADVGEAAPEASRSRGRRMRRRG